MSGNQTVRSEAERKALSRRNIRTALGLGLVALLVYVGYFLFRYMT